VIYVRKQSNATVIQAQGNIRTDRSEEFISLHAELHHTYAALKPVNVELLCGACFNRCSSTWYVYWYCWC